MSDCSERNLFEELVNALIHQYYLINRSKVHIDMFDDYFVIYSPADLVDSTMIQERNIENIPYTRRNPILADIFARIGYMKRINSG